jgi:hypothetical protein
MIEESRSESLGLNVDPELVRFSQFISEKIGAGGSDISPEEALELWRSENPTNEDRSETLHALEEALQEMRAGDRGVSLDEFDRTLRERNGFGHL